MGEIPLAFFSLLYALWGNREERLAYCCLLEASWPGPDRDRVGR